MAESFNYAEIRFTNPILIDIFSRYTDNTVMAELISEDGEFVLKFKTYVESEPPKCCEHVLSLFFALLESNPQSQIGRIYMENKANILGETVFCLAQVLDGFSHVKLAAENRVPDENSPTGYSTIRSETVLTHSKHNN